MGYILIQPIMPPIMPPITPVSIIPSTVYIINAGMAAMAAFTIKTTIDINGILMSTIFTLLTLSVSIFFSLNFHLTEIGAKFFGGYPA